MSRRPQPAPSPASQNHFPAPRIKAWLALLVAVYVALACAYSAITPAGGADQHNPDENAHLLYVAAVASGHLPVFHAGQADYEAHQPPLYYILCAPVYQAAADMLGSDSLISPQAQARRVGAGRLVSVLLGALLILVTFLCVRECFPENPWLALGAAAFVALLPMNIAVCASVSNDALSDLLVAAALWRLARLVRRLGQAGAPPAAFVRACVWLGLSLGAGLWAKTSALLVFPVVAFALYALARRGLTPPRIAVRAAGLSLGIGLLVGTPWLLRNQVLYGDPLAQHVFETSFGNTAQASDLIRYVFGGSISAYLGGVARWTFASFWGVFDSMRAFWGQDPRGHPPSPAAGLPAPYDVLALLCVVTLAGLVMRLRRLPRPDAWQEVLLQAFGVLVALTALAHLRFVLVFFQAQGRYWFPALVPLALFWTLGLSGLAPRPAALRAVVLLMALGLIALNVYTLLALLGPRFAPATTFLRVY